MIEANENTLTAFLKSKAPSSVPSVVAGTPATPVPPPVENPLVNIQTGLNQGGATLDSVVKILDSLNNLVNSPLVNSFFKPEKKMERIKVEDSRPLPPPKRNLEDAEPPRLLTPVKEVAKTEEPKKEEVKPVVKEEMQSIDKAMLVANFVTEFLGAFAKETPQRPVKEIYDELIVNREPFIMGLQTRFNVK